MAVRTDWANGESFTATSVNELSQAALDASALAAGKAPVSRTITAGTGLTGGGDLTANLTLAADFGTGAGKVCQGNDPRLSDPRTPGDNTVTTAKLHSTVFGTSAGTACQGDDARLAAPQAPTYQTGATLATAAVTSPRHRVYATAQNTDIAIANPSGSPTYGWQVMYEIIASGADRAIGYGTNFVGDDDMPTTAKNGKLLRIGFEWSPAAAKWVYMGKRELP